MPDLAGRTLIMSGGSRGIGLAIALRAAADGANVVIMAKTSDPHPKLRGTIHTAAAEIEGVGGGALAVVGDVRSEADVERAVAAAVDRFGGIDIVVNNASALNFAKTPELSMKAFDLMYSINTRGTFLLSKTAIPYLEKSRNPHILTMSPPLDLSQERLARYVGYLLSKYGMTLCTLGLGAELADRGIAANALWPATLIATDAVRNLIPDATELIRSPRIVADAAHAILVRDSRTCTGNTFMAEEVLESEGITDFSGYQADADWTDVGVRPISQTHGLNSLNTGGHDLPIRNGPCSPTL